MELVDGKSLREFLVEGPLPIRKTLQIAAHIADGLAAAHEKGVVHRDLKPENVMVGRGGFTKIVDFGLAKWSESGPVSDEAATLQKEHLHTRPGTVLGTVGYMSPEQAGGLPADFRSDQFSFGAILYEMLTGNRAFQKPTSMETMWAIIRDDPTPIVQTNPSTPLPMRWITERCLAKEPEERYGSTRDLARDLQRLRDAASETSLTAEIALPQARRRKWFGAAAVATIATVAVAAGVIAGRVIFRTSSPAFHRISFRHGYVTSARFTSDGKTVLYGASWEGKPIHTFSTRVENPEAADLGMPDGDVLAISKAGVLALSLGRHYTEWFVSNGKLAEAPLTGGGAPRELLDDVQDGDFAPDGQKLAVVRNVGGGSTIEYPIATTIYRTSGWVSHLRVSPDGEHVAFIDHPGRGDDRGTVRISNRTGTFKASTKEYPSAQGLAWSLSGKEVWFTASDIGFFSVLRAVTLKGAERVIYRAPSRLVLQDIAPDGRVLIVREEPRVGAVVLPPGAKSERDLSWLDATFVSDMTPDGAVVLLSEQGEGSGPSYSVYLRRTDGSPAVRLSDGYGTRLSPDGSRVLVGLFADPPKLEIVPTGAGSTKVLPLPVPNTFFIWPSWFPDGKRIYYALTDGRSVRLWAQNVDGGKAVPISAEGVGGGMFPKPISPDGKWIAALAGAGNLVLVAVDGGATQPVPGVVGEEIALNFSSDGRYLYTAVPGEMPARIYRVDLVEKKRDVWKVISPPDPAGITFIQPMQITPDGSSYAYCYARMVGDLFVVEGLR